MEPDGSLPCPQELTTDPYPGPDEASPNYPIVILYDPFYYYPPMHA
jgi:hypothetical protein